MWNSAIVAYFHYLGFMLAFAALIVELFNLKPDITLEQAKKVAFADIVYGIAAVTVLGTGVLRLLYFGKGTAYYMHNPFFLAKMIVFIVVGLLSLYPTITFILWFKNLQKGEAPILEVSKINILSSMIKVELFGFTVLPLLAAIMARIGS